MSIESLLADLKHSGENDQQRRTRDVTSVTPPRSIGVTASPLLDEDYTLETPATSHSDICESGPEFSHWCIHFADKEQLQVTFAPAVNHATARGFYPTLIAVEPVVKAGPRTPTAPELDELRLLIESVFADDCEADRTEALAVAILDVDDALVCYRDLSQKRVT